MNNVSEFENYWNKFITRLKGTFMNKSNTQNLTCSVANLFLSDAAISWGLSYDDCGRWLIEYSKQNPEKGDLIMHILTKDMHFTKISQKKNLPEAAKIATPVAAAAIGGGIAHLLNANMWIKLASIIVPAAISYPAIKTVGGMVENNNKEYIISEYINQLEKYKNSIITIISDN